MNKTTLGVISGLLALGLIKKKGSSSHWNNFLIRSNMWQRAYCHQENPTYSSIGFIGYLSKVFEDSGFVQTDSNDVDVLYSHLMLKDFEEKETLFFNQDPESGNFFRLYDQLSQNEIPVFILGINPMSAKGKNIDNFIKALSVTVNGDFSHSTSNVIQMWNALLKENVKLERLYYHTYVIDVKATDIGLPLHHQKMTYIIGFKATKPKDKKDFPYYLTQPIFNHNLDFSSFLKIKASDIIGQDCGKPLEQGQEVQFIKAKTLLNLKQPNYNTKFFTIGRGDKSENIFYPLRYEQKGAVTATYVVDGDKVRTLSTGEIRQLHDIDIFPFNSFTSFNETIQRFSFSRGLGAILKELKFLFECPVFDNYTAEKFYTHYLEPRINIPYISPVKIGGMFSGIGGFEYGLSRGLSFRGIPSTVLWDYETDTVSSEIFSSHFPTSKNLGSIVTHSIPKYVDVITMGFPCPDVSCAGLRRGIKKGTASGLFLDAFDIAMKVDPKLIFMENVGAILHKNKGTDTAPVEVVFNKFKQAGWTLEWCTVTAKQFGAPHLRERWFCIAHKSSDTLMIDRDSDLFGPVQYHRLDNLPKNGCMIQGKVYFGSPKTPLDMGIRSPIYHPTPLASDWTKRPTGGLRMRLQEGIKRSTGRDRTYPQPLPQGYEWGKRGGVWTARRKPSFFTEVLNPSYVEWMMGFPKNWIYGKANQGFDPYSWSEGTEIPQLVDKSKITNKGVFKSLGNAIVPQIPEFIAYAYLWEFLKK
jgi:DNA (cytosine-5)-methyltransferase 1